MKTFIKRDLPNDEYQAAVGANNPSSANVFATMSDIVAGTGDANRLVFDAKISQVGGINKGQAVYVSGANGTNILISKADYSTEPTSSKTLGLLVASGANNALGQVVAEGILKGTGSAPLDTSAAIAGDPVWLGDNGDLIYGLINKPYAPNHLVFIGIVVEANNTVGEIFVKIQNGFELNEIHNVDLITNAPTNGQLLTYNGSTGLWEASSIPPAVSGGTQLLTGGASWSGTGMVFDVTALTYQIDGINYSSVATTVTLPVGDALNPRFDAIVVDEFGVVSFISGIPSSNPVTPNIPGNQVLVQYVLVNAGAIVPNITDQWVYRESQAGDWVGSIIGGAPAPTAVWNSPTPAPPFAGTACLLASYSAYSTSRYIRLQAPAPISRATYVGLSLRVYLPQNFSTLDGGLGRRPYIQLKGGPSLTALGITYLDQHGLNPTLVGVWQQVTIPTAFFGANAGITDIRQLELFLVKSTFTPNTYVNIAYDNIVFQSGFGTVTALPTIDILDSGTVIGSTSKLNFIDGTNTTTVVTQDIPNNKIDVRIDAASTNIYNTDGTLAGPRILDLNAQGLSFQDTTANGQFSVNMDDGTLKGVDLVVNAIFSSLDVYDNVTGEAGALFIDKDQARLQIFSPSGGGIRKIEATPIGIQVNGLYTFPNTDGLLNQVLTTDGAGVLSWATSAAGNIYSTDGSLTGTRTLSGAGFDLIFNSLNTFTTTIAPSGGVNGFVVNVDTTLMSGATGTRIFKIVDTNTGNERFGILRNGNVRFNNAYTFPSSDGAALQVLSTNGSGILQWTDRLDTLSFYNQFMVNQFSYFLPSDSSVLYDTLRAGGTLTSSGTTSALVENPMGVLYTTATAVGSAVSLYGNTFGGNIFGLNFQFELFRKFRINSTNGAQRFFTGLSSLYTTTAPTNIEPTSQINSIGVCKLQASSTLFLMWNDSTGVASSIDTGFSAVSNAFTYLLRIYKTYGIAQIELELTQITNSTGATSVFVQTITSDYNTGSSVYPVAWMGNNTAVTGAVSFKDYGCIMTKRNVISA